MRQVHREAPMRALYFLVVLLASCGLSSREECTSKTETYDGKTVALETCTAVVDDVVAANAEGYRFVAYVVKWRGQRVVVSDVSADSNLVAGDRVSFTVMKFPPLNDTSMPMK